MESDTPPQLPPRLRLHARFDPLVTMYRHPVRLAVSLAVPLLAFPELESLSGWLTGFHGAFAGFATMLLLIALIFLPQFFMTWLDCRHVSYDVYDDRLVFTENFILRTPINIYYRSVTGVTVKINPAQRLRGLADIMLTTQARLSVRTPEGRAPLTGQAQHYVIPDLTRAEARSAKRAIETFVAQVRAGKKEQETQAQGG
jgi:hypothetical protein